MRRTGGGLFLLMLMLMLIGRAGAEDGLRLPRSSSATVTAGSDRATVVLPFGEVHIHPADVAEPRPTKTPPGPVRARTHGTFRLSYELVREGADVVARNVRVKVENRQEFMGPPTGRLREHEDVHGRINERSARRMEKTLSGFRASAVTPAEAERRFKALFRKEARAARRLHADWDETHVFVSTAAAAP